MRFFVACVRSWTKSTNRSYPMPNHPNHPNRSNLGAAVAPDEFRRLVESHGLTQQAAADLLLSTRRTVENWVGGQRRIPAMAAELLRLKLALRARGILDEIEAEAGEL